MPSTKLPKASGSKDVRPGSHIFLPQDSRQPCKLNRKRQKHILWQASPVSNPRVGLKVAVVDGLDQLLGNLDDLLLAGWETERETQSSAG